MSYTVAVIAPGVNGVVGNGTTDDYSAIQSILTNNEKVRWWPGTYLIKTGLSVTCSTTWGPQIEGFGFGTYILASSSISGGAALQVNLTTGDPNDFRISGLTVVNQTAGQGADYGLQISGGSGDSSTTTRGIFENIYASGFAYNFIQYNCRQISWLRSAAWNEDHSGTATSGEYGWYIYAGASGFVGDSDWTECETVSSASGFGVTITDQGSASAGLNGMRFKGCDFYAGSNTFEIALTGSGSSAGDIWVCEGCQFNGPNANNFVVISLSSSGQLIQDLHFDNVYFTACNSVAILANAGSGEIRSMFVNDCFIDGTGNKAIYVDGADFFGAQITNNTFSGISNSGAQAVLINNGTGHTFIGNVMYNDPHGTNTVDYFVSLGSSGNYLIVTNNQSCGAPSFGCVENLGASNLINNNNQ